MTPPLYFGEAILANRYGVFIVYYSVLARAGNVPFSPPLMTAHGACSLVRDKVFVFFGQLLRILYLTKRIRVLFRAGIIHKTIIKFLMEYG